MDYLLAHDLGTTGDKASLYTAAGKLVATAFVPYATRYGPDGSAEQNPLEWWSAFCAAGREIERRVPEISRRLACVGLSGMMNGCVLIDSKGELIRPAMIHADIRSGAESERIGKEVGRERVHRLTGNHAAPYFTLSKLAWLAEHEPWQLARCGWCLQTKDYLLGRLTGVWGVTDPSDASLTGCWDLQRERWSGELAEAARFSPSILPEVAPSLQVVARASQAAASECGIPDGTAVVLGGGDGACATAGSGAVRPGDAYHYLGGTSWIAAVTDGYLPDRTGRLCVFHGLQPDEYVLYGTVQSAGSSLDWFLSSASTCSEPRHGGGYEELDRLAGGAPVGSNGLLFLPYLMGERSPIWDSKARGVFFGLSAAHKPEDLARSVLEGVA
ncbi:MAG TPA: FGGY family carbohydrate kinase, partial [Chthonomonadales bacterium]|nr:FGGY family carbohydrate kinase [Chthonomonadales bacterium]